MKHVGDITKLNGAELSVVDIITGGSPCQDLSVAGKRAGLAGERSGLFMEQIRIIKEMREHDRAIGRTDEHIRPRYMVWENVPGSFSSNGGKDFHAVLEETAKVAEGNASIPRFEGGRWPSAGCIMGNGWSIAWRVHDAQFWGVPQRRKRIALVADFGGTTAPEILFERKSVRGDIEQGGTQGEGLATDVKKSTGVSSPSIINLISKQLATSVNDIALTLEATDYKEPQVICLNDQGGQQMNVSEEVSGTLRAQEHGHQPIVYGQGSFGNYENKIISTLKSSGGDCGGGSENLCVDHLGVRKLTPLECERLQGYPDGWTDIGEWVDTKGKLHKDADSPRYKALGNSIALPFWEWMAERMLKYISGTPTMASLFDGIGGFPLVFSRHGCVPVWASEIEQFPIAVTKKRFPDSVDF